MAKELVLVDTSILIDFFRKSDKANSRLITLNVKHFERVDELILLP
jgi:predicted nucleic acid-binding protein